MESSRKRSLQISSSTVQQGDTKRKREDVQENLQSYIMGSTQYRSMFEKVEEDETAKDEARDFFVTHSLNPMIDPTNVTKENPFGYIRSSNTAYKNDQNTQLYESYKGTGSYKGTYAAGKGKRVRGQKATLTGLDFMKLGFAEPVERRMGLNPFEKRMEQLNPIKPSAYADKIEKSRYACRLIAAETKELEYITVHAEHGYTCAMVEVKEVPDVDKRLDKYWVKLCMCIYSGIVNYFAIANKSGFYLGERSSFNHVSSSLADCYLTFRISPGVISKQEVDILINGLKILNDFVCHSLDIKQNDVINKLFGKVNKTKLIKELVRNAVTSCSLSNEITNYLLSNLGRFSGLLHHICGDRDSYFGRTYDTQDDKVSFLKEKAVMLSQESWLKIQTNLTHLEEDVKEIYGGLATGLDFTGQSNITIAGQLQKAFGGVLRSTHLEAEEGYGSDSDCEADEIFGQKVVLPTGMRAIVVACCALAEVVGFFEKIDGVDMYFELPDIQELNNLKRHVIGTSRGKEKKNGTLYLRDKNSCINIRDFKRNDHSLLNDISTLSPYGNDHYIWDVTSSTAKEMGEIVKEMIINKGYPCVVLVSSPLKSEGMGFDGCHTGMVRVFSKSKDIMKAIVGNIREKSNTPVSALTNQIRKTIKFHFGTPTIREILSYCK
jgi:hypothetical protein